MIATSLNVPSLRRAFSRLADQMTRLAGSPRLIRGCKPRFTARRQMEDASLREGSLLPSLTTSRDHTETTRRSA